MKIFDKIQSCETGEMKALLTTPKLYENVDEISYSPNVAMEVRHSLCFGVISCIPDGSHMMRTRKEFIRLLAEDLYGEAVFDLLEILKHVHHECYDPELTGMINKLIAKMRPSV